eukprot:3495934-Pyramimonas_sp.AAC.1
MAYVVFIKCLECLLDQIGVQVGYVCADNYRLQGCQLAGNGLDLSRVGKVKSLPQYSDCPT